MDAAGQQELEDDVVYSPVEDLRFSSASIESVFEGGKHAGKQLYELVNDLCAKIICPLTSLSPLEVVCYNGECYCLSNKRLWCLKAYMGIAGLSTLQVRVTEPGKAPPACFGKQGLSGTGLTVEVVPASTSEDQAREPAENAQRAPPAPARPGARSDVPHGEGLGDEAQAVCGDDDDDASARSRPNDARWSAFTDHYWGSLSGFRPEAAAGAPPGMFVQDSTAPGGAPAEVQQSRQSAQDSSAPVVSDQMLEFLTREEQALEKYAASLPPAVFPAGPRRNVLFALPLYLSDRKDSELAVRTASSSGSEDLIIFVQFLIGGGHCPTDLNNDGRSPLEYAFEFVEYEPFSVWVLANVVDPEGKDQDVQLKKHQANVRMGSRGRDAHQRAPPPQSRYGQDYSSGNPADAEYYLRRSEAWHSQAENFGSDAQVTGIVDDGRFEDHEDADSQDAAVVGASDGVTAMMRNIPNKYTRDMLVERLQKDFLGQFDFLYLPTDFTTKANVGYAFINWRTVDGYERFKRHYDGVLVSQCLPGTNSSKVVRVRLAKWHGLTAHVTNLWHSPVMEQLVENPQWMPIIMNKEGEPKPFANPHPAKPNKTRRRTKLTRPPTFTKQGYADDAAADGGYMMHDLGMSYQGDWSRQWHPRSMSWGGGDESYNKYMD